MGEIADMILRGELCEICGVIMPDMVSTKKAPNRQAPGYPRKCKSCRDGEDADRTRRQAMNDFALRTNGEEGSR